MCVQADALEHALVAALPLGPQSPAGGVFLPESFAGELQVRMLPLRKFQLPGCCCPRFSSCLCCSCPAVRAPQ